MVYKIKLVEKRIFQHDFFKNILCIDPYPYIPDNGISNTVFKYYRCNKVEFEKLTRPVFIIKLINRYILTREIHIIRVHTIIMVVKNQIIITKLL